MKEAALLLGDYRDIADFTVQFATVFACHDFEADGNALEAIIELTDFDQLGLPGLAAVFAPDAFNPRFTHRPKYTSQSRGVCSI